MYKEWSTIISGTRSKSTRDQNQPAFKIHPVKFERRLQIEGKG